MLSSLIDSYEHYLVEVHVLLKFFVLWAFRGQLLLTLLKEVALLDRLHFVDWVRRP